MTAREQQIRALFLDKKGNQLAAQGMLPFDEINRAVWNCGAEVFLPCAGSRLVTQAQVEQLRTHWAAVQAALQRR